MLTRADTKSVGFFMWLPIVKFFELTVENIYKDINQKKFLNI